MKWDAVLFLAEGVFRAAGAVIVASVITVVSVLCFGVHGQIHSLLCDLIFSAGYICILMEEFIELAVAFGSPQVAPLRG